MTSALDDLAARIPAQITKVIELLKATETPAPRFDEAGAQEIKGKNAVPVAAVGKQEKALLDARGDLVNLAADLLYLARGPVDHLLALGYAEVDTANLGTIVRFDIPQKVPFGEAIAIADLAIATGLPEDILTRTVRYAITNGIFQEPSYGNIAHSAASATLAKNKCMHDISVFNTGFGTRICVCIADALEEQKQNPQNAPESAFNVAYPGFSDLFEYVGKNPLVAQAYFNFLDGRSTLPRFAIGNILSSWDWESVATGTIVDVGGSSGDTAMALARHLPQATVIVEDINPTGLKMGRKVATQEAAIASRMSFLEHDFFQPQPVEADVYLFRHILHDWSDSNVVKIIQALLPALKDGSRVLLSENIMPDKPAARTATTADKQTRIDDHVMMAAHSGADRMVKHYTRLFSEASGAFTFVGITEQGHYSLVEYMFTKRGSNLAN